MSNKQQKATSEKWSANDDLRTKISPFLNQWKYKSSDLSYEKPTGISLAVPDQSYSVKEILQMFTRGSDPMLSKVPDYQYFDDNENYLDDEVLIGQPDLDLTDIENAKAFIYDAQSAYKEATDKASKQSARRADEAKRKELADDEKRKPNDDDDSGDGRSVVDDKTRKAKKEIVKELSD